MKKTEQEFQLSPSFLFFFSTSTELEYYIVKLERGLSI